MSDIVKRMWLAQIQRKQWMCFFCSLSKPSSFLLVPDIFTVNLFSLFFTQLIVLEYRHPASICQQNGRP